VNAITDFTQGIRVRYQPFIGCDESQYEFGNVSSTNAKYVFVKFDKQVQKLGWDGATSQSCRPEDLRILK